MSSKTTLVLVLAAVLVALPILMCGGCLVLMGTLSPEGGQITTTEQPDVPPVPEIEIEDEAPAAPKLTAETYGRVHEGMTYGEVVEIVGPPDSEMASSNIGDIQTVVYSWKGGWAANANMTFQNGKLVSKAQFGLPAVASSGGANSVDQNPSDLSKFIAASKAVRFDSLLANELPPEHSDDHTLTITVNDEWHTKPHQVRVQTAKIIRDTWATVHSIDNPNQAELRIVDVNGKEVARATAGSVWVAQ